MMLAFRIHQERTRSVCEDSFVAVLRTNRPCDPIRDAATLTTSSVHIPKGKERCILAQIGFAITNTPLEQGLLFNPRRGAPPTTSPSWQ